MDKQEASGSSIWRMLPRPTAAEAVLLIFGLCAWVAVLAWAAPPLGSYDVYSFRDPAINFLLHRGFVTSSSVLTQSFQPVFYTLYTPGSAWAYMPFGMMFGIGARSAQIYYLFLALLADLVFIALILRTFSPGWHRWLVLLLLVLVAPSGIINAELDRPENLALLALMAVLFALRGNSALRISVAGFLAGIAFLVEPIAGIFAIVFVAGALIFHQESDLTAARRIKHGFSALLCFALPVLVTCCFYFAIDHSFITHFLAHIHRVLAKGTRAHGAPAPFVQRFAGTLEHYRGLGISGWIRFCGYCGILAGWVAFCCRSRSNKRTRLALVFIGIFLFLFTAAVFAEQLNYTLLVCGIFPFVIFFNWCGTGEFQQTVLFKSLVVWLLALQSVPVAISVIQQVESRSSYAAAMKQAELLRTYLQSHNIGNGTVIVPAYQYYIYKPKITNIYDPIKLVPAEDPEEVVAVVNCNTQTSIFKAQQRPLPKLVAEESFQMISPGTPLRVTIFHHQIMSKNWTWTCDLYARP